MKQLLAIGRPRPRVRHRAHRRVRRRARGARGRVVRPISKRRRARPRDDMARFARMYAAAKRGGARVVDGHHAARDTASTTCRRSSTSVSRAATSAVPGAGLMPIRGHSGVQGGAEMGCYATAFPGRRRDRPTRRGRARRRSGASRCRRQPGLTAAEMVDAARRGELDVLWSSGGNFLDVLPAPDVTRTALRRARRCACTRTSCVTHQMLVEPGRDRRAAAGRDALRAGGRRHVDHHRTPRRVQSRDPGPARRRGAVGVARSSRDVARRVRPGAAPTGSVARRRDGDPRRDRARRARVRRYRAAARDRRRDPGRRRAAVRRRRLPDAPTAGPTSASSCPVDRDVPDGRFVLSTRRGKQFNSMVWNDVDPLTGAGTRRAVPRRRRRGRARRRRRRRGARALATYGEIRARVHLAPIRPGNVQAFFPEANLLLSPTRREPISGVPDYNAVVEVVPVAMTPDALLELLRRRRRGAVRDAVAPIDAVDAPRAHDRRRAVRARPRRRRCRARRARRPPVRIVSEESGVHERAGAAITVVLDPVDGSTNCSRGIAYWATSICRARRRRPARGARREPGDRRARRRRSAARARSATASRCARRTSRGSRTP